MTPTRNREPHDAWQVICLCAAWCGACREWESTFRAVAAAHPQMRFSWVDIEDHADALGDVDIETFPTLLIARGMHPRFFGPVQPSAEQLKRLLASLLSDPHDGPGAGAEARTLLQRLVAVVLPKS